MAQFAEAPRVQNLRVVMQPDLLKAFLMAKIDPFNLRDLSLFSFYPSTLSCPILTNKPTRAGKQVCADHTSYFFETCAVFLHPAFLDVLHTVSDEIKGVSSVCANWGDEFSFFRIHQIICTWTNAVATQAAPEGVSYREEAGADFLSDMLLTGLRDQGPQFPHALFYDGECGFKQLQLPYSPPSRNLGATHPPPPPPAISQPSTDVCPFHLLFLAKASRSPGGPPITCSKTNCGLLHPASLSAVTKAQGKSILDNRRFSDFHRARLEECVATLH
jgi:hypothetical protein